MALVLATQNTTWQNVTVKAPGKKGFDKQVFEAEFKVPSQDEFEDAVKENTVEECLKLWFINARKIQATHDDPAEIEFTDAVKQQLIGTPWVRASLWESLQDVISGGRLKN